MTSPAPLPSPPPPATVERWAWDYVTSESLEHKLRPPPRPASWEPGAPARRLAAPGRPAALRVAARSPRAPGPDAIRDPRRRAQLLHTFLHHELQAAELMAWALLAFPDEPRAFRIGLLGVLDDELRHMRLYDERLAALGARFGDEPVRDWFWQRVPLAERALQFVAVLGIGLEGGNLDHAARFAERFRRAGDEPAARVQEQVAEEELPHVRFALRWFERWTGEPAAGFDRWASALPPPLSPLLMRGDPVNRPLRLRAGFSPDFLDRLVQWTPAPPGS